MGFRATGLMETQMQTHSSSSGEGPAGGGWGGRKARGLLRHLPGRVSSGFVDEMTFARGPAGRTFWAEKEVEGVHTEGGAEAKPREGEGTACLGSGESLLRLAQASPRWWVTGGGQV